MSLSLSCWIHCMYYIWLACRLSSTGSYSELFLSYRFNRVAHYISGYHDFACLPYSVHPAHGLRFRHWVPVRFNQVYMVGGCEVNPKNDQLSRLWLSQVNMGPFNSPFSGAANTRKHYSASGIFVELTYCLASPFKVCLAVYSLEAKAMWLKCLLDQIEHFCPVTENNAKKSQQLAVIRFEKRGDETPLDGPRRIPAGFNGLFSMKIP